MDFWKICGPLDKGSLFDPELVFSSFVYHSKYKFPARLTSIFRLHSSYVLIEPIPVHRKEVVVTAMSVWLSLLIIN
jgi:hypothetical protein